MMLKIFKPGRKNGPAFLGMEKTPRIRKGEDVYENIAALHTEPLSFLGIWFAACFPKAGDKFDNFVTI